MARTVIPDTPAASNTPCSALLDANNPDSSSLRSASAPVPLSIAISASSTTLPAATATVTSPGLTPAPCAIAAAMSLILEGPKSSTEPSARNELTTAGCSIATVPGGAGDGGGGLRFSCDLTVLPPSPRRMATMAPPPAARSVNTAAMHVTSSSHRRRLRCLGWCLTKVSMRGVAAEPSDKVDLMEWSIVPPSSTPPTRRPTGSLPARSQRSAFDARLQPFGFDGLHTVKDSTP